jgi:1-acyl-sn-glycerol-3-phosphate acyltransferase
MIKPKKNVFITGFFSLYIDWIIKLNFKQVNFNDPYADNNQAILMVANHFSWWDGFLLYYVNKRLFKKNFHVMVLEETVAKLGFLRYLGAFTVAKHSKDVINTLQYAAELLNDAGNLVLIYPQGKIYSNFIDDIVFEKGIWNIVLKTKTSFQYVLVTTFIENFNYKKPIANIHLKTHQKADFNTADDLQTGYNNYYEWAKQQQTAIVI